jgi:hypothetical protein
MTVEELRARLVPYLKGDDGMLHTQLETLDSLIVAVEERTKKGILDASITQFPMGSGTYMMIRTSVLAPKEADNGTN